MPRFALVAMLFVVSKGLCQTPAKESDTLQALLIEVHQLRQSIQAMTVASQRVQIALYALQMQDAAVARATQRVNSVRNKCSGAESNKNQTAAVIQKLETRLASGAAASVETKELQAALAHMKSQFEVQSGEAQNCQAADADASSQLRNDQAKLLDLHARIERLDSVLEKLGDGK